MIIKVTDSSGKYLGYLLDNVWIPKEILWVYTPIDSLPYEDIKQGYKRRNNIEVENSIYKNILYNFTNKAYIDEVFTSNNIKMNDIILLSYTDFDYNSMSSLWRVPASKSERLVLFYKNDIVGYLQVKNSFSDDCIYVGMFETVEKDKGYGSKCIQFLLSHKSIKGYSVISARRFWESMGAEFDKNENCRFKIQGGI